MVARGSGGGGFLERGGTKSPFTTGREARTTHWFADPKPRLSLACAGGWTEKEREAHWCISRERGYLGVKWLYQAA